jgi:hypothetical protein
MVSPAPQKRDLDRNDVGTSIVTGAAAECRCEVANGSRVFPEAREVIAEEEFSFQINSNWYELPPSPLSTGERGEVTPATNRGIGIVIELSPGYCSPRSSGTGRRGAGKGQIGVVRQGITIATSTLLFGNR